MMLQGFCRLFLSIQDGSDETRIQLHIRPDVTQPNDLIGVISCASLEALGICLEELGASGVATQISEINSGPVSGFISSSVPEILQYVAAQKPVTLTIIAADTSTHAMQKRLAALQARQVSGIRIKPA